MVSKWRPNTDPWRCSQFETRKVRTNTDFKVVFYGPVTYKMVMDRINLDCGRQGYDAVWSNRPTRLPTCVCVEPAASTFTSIMKTNTTPHHKTTYYSPNFHFKCHQVNYKYSEVPQTLTRPQESNNHSPFNALRAWRSKRANTKPSTFAPAAVMCKFRGTITNGTARDKSWTSPTATQLKGVVPL